MKIRIESKDGDIWRNYIVELRASRKGNYYFQHDGKIYVFHENKQGVPVLCKIANDANAHWEKAGRITKYHQVFLGEGLSFSEFNEQNASLEREQPVFA
jgi:hypothetical protein